MLNLLPSRAFLIDQWVKNPSAMQETQETQVRSLGWNIPWRRKWHPTPVFLPGKFHGQRSLAGYSPGSHMGRKQSNMTEHLAYLHSKVIQDVRLTSFNIIYEGNGTPLQYSCLENPMGGGSWWAAVHGVAKSRTRLSDFTFIFHFHAFEKEMATHSGVLAWRIPGMAEPGGLPSMGSHRVRHD